MKKATDKSKTTPPMAASTPAAKPKAAPKAKAAAKEKPAAPAPAAKSSAPVSTATTITAVIDIGFGNSLSLRGEGPGLSWHKGTEMDCVADDKWSLTLHGATAPVVFKFLVNDLSWSAGADYIVQPGAEITVTPTF